MGMNVAVGDDIARMIEEMVDSGEYGSPRAVVEDATRRLALDRQSDDEKLAWLRQAYEEGIASGDAGELDIEKVIKEARRQYEAGE